MWTAEELFARDFLKEMDECLEDLHWLRSRMETLDKNSVEYRSLYEKERVQNIRFPMLQKMHIMKCEYEALKAEFEDLKASL